MALTKQTTLRQITIRLKADGTFAGAVRSGVQEVLEDGIVIAERPVSQERTLAQVKADVAAL